MTNLVTTAYADNEAGTTSWTLGSGTATLSNSATFANTGSQSFKGISGAAASFKVTGAYADRFSCTAGALINFSMYVRASAAVFVDWGVDWYNGGGGYITTDTFAGQTANTSAFALFSDSKNSGTAVSFVPWFQLDATATSQIIYMDTYNAEYNATFFPQIYSTD